MSDSFTRREAIGSAALGAGAATLGGMQAIAQTVPRKTFVLIHGAYHGGWCWRKVVDILEKQGHKVYAPSLTGLADRSHLLSMNLTLDTHITDIVNLFKWEDINNGCLGSTPEAAGRAPARLNRSATVFRRSSGSMRSYRRTARVNWTRSPLSAARRWKKP